jgi:hypothetical protein
LTSASECARTDSHAREGNWRVAWLPHMLSQHKA